MKNKLILIIVAISFLSLKILAQGDTKTKVENNSPNKTITILEKNINSELQAFKYYSACSQKALKEGYPKVAEEFSDIASQENSHYKRFKDILKKRKIEFTETEPKYVVLSTRDNVSTSYHLEEVADNVYENDIKQAESVGYKDVAEGYKWAQAMEKTHKDIFKNLFDNFDSYKKQ
jgi:rubrerythrin